MSDSESSSSSSLTIVSTINIRCLFYRVTVLLPALLQLEHGQASLVKTDSLPTLVALTTRVLVGLVVTCIAEAILWIVCRFMSLTTKVV